MRMLQRIWFIYLNLLGPNLVIIGSASRVIQGLYLANSSYGCWIETGFTAEIDFNVSPVLLDDVVAKSPD